jgi:hypothetical protein
VEITAVVLYLDKLTFYVVSTVTHSVKLSSRSVDVTPKSSSDVADLLHPEEAAEQHGAGDQLPRALKKRILLNGKEAELRKVQQTHIRDEGQVEHESCDRVCSQVSRMKTLNVLSQVKGELLGQATPESAGARNSDFR